MSNKLLLRFVLISPPMNSDYGQQISKNHFSVLPISRNCDIGKSECSILYIGLQECVLYIQECELVCLIEHLMQPSGEPHFL